MENVCGAGASDPAAQEANSSDGGFPVWGIVVLVLGGIAAVGGGVGLMMARNRNEDELAEVDVYDDDPFDAPPPDDPTT